MEKKLIFSEHKISPLKIGILEEKAAKLMSLYFTRLTFWRHASEGWDPDERTVSPAV